MRKCGWIALSRDSFPFSYAFVLSVHLMPFIPIRSPVISLSIFLYSFLFLSLFHFFLAHSRVVSIFEFVYDCYCSFHYVYSIHIHTPSVNANNLQTMQWVLGFYWRLLYIFLLWYKQSNIKLDNNRPRKCRNNPDTLNWNIDIYGTI